ncbi:TetR/AcrR family transcriptional regulator [Parasphingopyxis marina]|uniref:TetR/AcrR family transcriptional regulator n=1 Tax=Parasphingopyxis marina TaxID=2761622 RepID=A0A842I2E3_9SPHN|nr:TetR/AcrR family transcriptional regulator [Parasphingopyxis marina]MBC2778889.1 TetR/AcrR family transcriptional regulator [Parasphingopyxis marina]
MNVTAPLARKGRPREFCVETALSAALGVFWTKGFDAASLTDLTEAMGVTRPSLYAAFGNKEQLFKSALDLYEREKLAYVSNAMAAPTARGVAEALLYGALDLLAQDDETRGCLGVLSTMACNAEADSIREDVLARQQSSKDAMIARFQRAADEGELPAGMSPQAIADYLRAIMQGLSIQARSGAGRPELEQIVETSLALWPTK